MLNVDQKEELAMKMYDEIKEYLESQKIKIPGQLAFWIDDCVVDLCSILREEG